MTNLKTTYLGLELKNPIIAGASDLMSKTENLKALEESGAAAIVYKSLFEEQIQLESYQLDNQMNEYNDRHAEMISLFPDINHAGPQLYLQNLKKAKETVKIPVIASLNAVYKESWLEYSKLIEDTGVDAIELNFYAIPRDFDKAGSDTVKEQVDIVKEVKKILNIPVSVKLSPYYTNTLAVIKEMEKAGADGFVLFNKMFQPDIDLEKEEQISPFNLSSENEYRLPLRFAGLLHGRINAGICSSTGIYQGTDVIKLIMAGSDVVQVVSTLYRNKISHLTKMLSDMEAWMESKSYKSLKDFRGKLAEKNTKDPFVYKRAQYIDLLLKSGELTKGYSLR
jgi:dihydroorotate dehydrogenase (fumarate)